MTSRDPRVKLVTQLTNGGLNAKRAEQWERYLVQQNVFLVIFMFAVSLPMCNFWDYTYSENWHIPSVISKECTRPIFTKFSRETVQRQLGNLVAY